jgi:hypothetical protein
MGGQSTTPCRVKEPTSERRGGAFFCVGLTGKGNVWRTRPRAHPSRDMPLRLHRKPVDGRMSAESLPACRCPKPGPDTDIETGKPQAALGLSLDRCATIRDPQREASMTSAACRMPFPLTVPRGGIPLDKRARSRPPPGKEDGDQARRTGQDQPLIQGNTPIFPSLSHAVPPEADLSPRSCCSEQGRSVTCRHLVPHRAAR